MSGNRQFRATNGDPSRAPPYPAHPARNGLIGSGAPGAACRTAPDEQS